MATDCETCIHFNRQSRRCAAYDMPADLARSIPSFCGDAGADHQLRPDSMADRADWIVVAVLASCLAGAAVLKAQPEFITWLMAVLA